MNKQIINKYKNKIEKLKHKENKEEIVFEKDKLKVKVTSNITETGVQFDDGKRKIKMTPLVAKSVKKSELKKEENKIIYTNFNGKDDLEYMVYSNGVKENIIIKEPRKNYRFKFLIELENLKLNEETLDLLDKETLEKKYNIGNFIMSDKNGKTSKNIKYKLEEETENKYILTLNVDSLWLNEENRSFPIVVDPSISILEENILSIIVNNESLENDNLFLGEAKVGFINGVSNTATINVNFKKIINQIDCLHLNRYRVYLDLKIANGITSSVSGRYSIYDNSQLFFNDRLDNKEKIRLDVTEPCKRVIERINNYNFDYNYEFMIKNEYTNPIGSNASATTVIENDYIIIYSEHYNEEEKKPEIYLEYKDIESVPDANATKVINHGSAGVCTLDLYDGNAIYETKISSINCNNLSVNINHVWNFRKYQNRSKDDIETYFGKGWKSSLHQYLINTLGATEHNNDIISYIDGKGYSHNFREMWFYERYDRKNYVSKLDVFIDYDLKTKVLVDDVKYEVKCEYMNDENLTLIRGKNINNFDWLDKQISEYMFYVKTFNDTVELYRSSSGTYLIRQYYYETQEETNENSWIKRSLKSSNIIVNYRQYITDYSKVRKNPRGVYVDENNIKLKYEDNPCYIVLRDGYFKAKVLAKKYISSGIDILQDYDSQGMEIDLLYRKVNPQSSGKMDEEVFLNDEIINLINQRYMINQTIEKLKINMQQSFDNTLSLVKNLNTQFDLKNRNYYLTKESSIEDLLLQLNNDLNEYNFNTSQSSLNKQLELAHTQIEYLLVEYDNYCNQQDNLRNQLTLSIKKQQRDVNSL